MDTITGAELIVESLEANDVDHAFNIPGVGIFPLVDALAGSEDIRYVSGLNETSLGILAEGYGRAARKPAFVNVYHSSGTALALVGVTIAWSDRTPMVFTSTTSSRRLAGRDQYAAVPGDITDVTDPYTKWSDTIDAVERIPQAVARAVTIASTPPMGPVHLAFPMDLYREEIDADAVGSEGEPVESRYPSAPVRTTAVSEGYADTVVHADGEPSEAGLVAAAEILSEAEAPLIAAGGEVGQLYAVDELVALAETLGAGVVSEWRTPTYLPMPTDHPLYLGDIMGVVGADDADALETADAILSVGFEFTEARAGQYPIRSDQRIVHLATSDREVNKQVPADVALIGHPKPALARLGERLEDADLGDVDARRDRIAAQREAVAADVEATMELLEAGERPTAAEATVAALPDVFGDDLLLMSYAVMSGSYLSTVDFDDPDGYYGLSGKASAQGWAAPAAVGAAIARPDREVVAVNGDGGFLFTSPTPLYTAAYYDLPVTVVVLNNRGWGGGNYAGQLENEWNEDFLIGDFEDPPVDFEGLARGVGCRYERVESPADAEPALVSARDGDGPTVVEVPMDFRGPGG